MKTTLTNLHRLLIQASLGLLLAGIPALSRAEPAPEAKASESLPTIGIRKAITESTNYVGKQIVLEGLVTEVCKRKGCWALLHDSDPDAKGQIRVKQDEDGGPFKAFLPELQGKTIQVTGELHVTKIDADYLEKWEARVKAAAKKNEGKKEQEQSTQAVFNQIAELRERVNKSKEGYLSSYGLSVTKWEPKAEKQ